MNELTNVGYFFDNDEWVMIRPSGTEPKIKFYTMDKVKEGDLETKKDIAQKQIDLIEKFIMGTVETL